ncbi:MAG: hypothetical protein AAFP90_22405, partial [Planctomycetota bacterium]
MAKCEEMFFDWNEVRVTTATELSEVLSGLPEPVRAARRLKSNLRNIFETFYSFDLEHLKKENLGKALAKFQEMPSMTPFVLAYISQHGLGGHAIPVDFAGMRLMMLCGIVNESEAASGKVPGLERAVPKNKGIEFASSLQQASFALRDDPADKSLRLLVSAVNKPAVKLLEEIASGNATTPKPKKKNTKKKPQTAETETAGKETTDAATAAPKARPAAKTVAKKTTKATDDSAAKPKAKNASKKAETETSKAKPKAKAKTKTPAAKPAAKKAATTRSSTAAPTKKTTTKKTPAKKTPPKKAAAKKSSTTKSGSTKKSATKKSSAKSAKKKTPSSDNKKLTKSKPR